MRSFAADYRSAPHPDVMAAVMAACKDPTNDPYGQDSATAELTRWLAPAIGDGYSCHFVANGSAANQLALDALMQYPYEGIVCADVSHINTYECGGLERLGRKLLAVPNENGKITPEALRRFHDQMHDIHQVRPAVLSIENATSLGTVYNGRDLERLFSVAREMGMLIHIDGARLAYANTGILTSGRGTDLELVDFASPPDIAKTTFEMGADALSLGMTKVGGMLGDMVIFRHTHHGQAASRLHKQHGQLCARQHAYAAQANALYGGVLWIENARHATKMAETLRRMLEKDFDIRPEYPVESNAVFVRLPTAVIDRILESTNFYIQDKGDGTTVARWMCSWDTSAQDLHELLELLQSSLNQD